MKETLSPENPYNRSIDGKRKQMKKKNAIFTQNTKTMEKKKKKSQLETNKCKKKKEISKPMKQFP